MKKILILGSSHVGAIKQGFDLFESWNKSPSKFSLQYAALQGRFLKQLTISDLRINVPPHLVKALSKTFGSTEPIDLEKFDFIIFAHGPCRLSLSLYTDNRLLPPLSPSLIENIALSPSRPDLFLQLTKHFDPSRIIYLGAPLVSEKGKSKKHLKDVPIVKNETQKERILELSSLVREYCNHSLGQPQSASFVLPPANILTSYGISTLDAYIRGGTRFDGRVRVEGQDEDFEKDMVHGNADYGREVAKALISYLEERISQKANQ